MKKKILISLLAVLLLVCAVAVGVFADGSAGAEETFRVYKADLTLGTDLRFNIKVQTGALPEGAGEVKLLVWEGAVDGVDYTQATTETAGYTELTAPIENEEGLLVFTYSGINAKEIGKTLYLRAYYKCNGETIYTEAKRYSMAQYLHSIYDSSDDKEKAVIDALMAYGDAAQELGNEGEPLPKISDGVVKITVSGGKFADGFTCGKFLSGEKLNVVVDGTESEPMLTAELGEGWLWTMADGNLSYEAEAEYYDGIYIGKYENAFEVTVGENTEIHTDKTLAEVLKLANGGTVKLLSDVDMGEYNISLSLGEEITLDLNGKKITSSNAYLFDIYKATLTVQDSAGGGSATTTADTVFYLNYDTSVLTIESGEFTGAIYAVYVANGTATINGGTFTGDIFADTANGTLSIKGGTFSEDPSDYAANGYVAEATETGYIVRVATADEYVAAVTVGETTTKYTSLAAAFANANGGTVKLLKDVDMGKSDIRLGYEAETTIEITLDLNGKKIISSSAYLFDIYNATLTVQDSAGGGSATTTAQNVFSLKVESSVLTIESGEFTGATYAVYVANGTATIEGGTFTDVCVEGGKATIKGGTFTDEIHVSAGEVQINGGEFTSVFVEGGKATIEGGTFDGTYAVYVGGGEVTISGGSFTGKNTAVQVNGGTFTINNGTFVGEDDAVYVGGGTLNVNGGTFTSDNYAVCVQSDMANITITDGTFTSGYDAITVFENGDGYDRGRHV